MPKCAETHILLGKIGRTKRNTDDAIKEFNIALAIYLPLYGRFNQKVEDVYGLLEKTCYRVGRIDEAIAYSDTLLLIKVALYGENVESVAGAYLNRSVSYRNNGNFERSLSDALKALSIFQQLYGENNEFVGNTCNSIANTYADIGDQKEALAYYQRSLRIRRNLWGDYRRETAQSYSNIGLLYAEMGDFQRGLDSLFKSLIIRQKMLPPTDMDIAESCNNIGVAYRMRGDARKALEYHQEALRIRRVNLGDNHPLVAVSLGNIGIAYNYINEFEASIASMEQAIAIFQKTLGDKHIQVAATLMNLAGIYYQKKEYALCLEKCEAAMAIYKDILPENHPYYSNVFNIQGSAYSDSGKFPQAHEVEQKELENCLANFPKTHPYVITSQINVANNFMRDKKYEQAYDFYQLAFNALQGHQSAKKEELLFRMYLNRASLYRSWYKETKDLEMLNKAMSDLKAALTSRNAYREALLTNIDKSVLTQNTQELPYTGISVAMELAQATHSPDYFKEAYLFSGQSKSAQLYEAIKEANATQFAGLPDSVLQKEYDLKVDIAYYEKKQFEETQKGTSANDSLMAVWNSKLLSLRREYEVLKNNMANISPNYFQLLYSHKEETVENIQHNLLTDKSSFLEYFTGDSSIFLFVINKEGYQVKEIKKDFPLESWVRQLQYGLSAYHSLLPNAPPRENFAFRDSCTRAYITAAQDLYDKLVKPVKNLLKAEVIIVPDGMLGYVPFEVLLTGPTPADINRYHKYPYLLRDHRIRYTYSATLLKEMTDKKHRREPEKRFAAFAPYYDGDTSVLAGLDQLITSRTVTPDALAPLKYSGPEVMAAQKLMGGDVFMDSTATEERFNREAGNYRILHLSTHGKADDRVGDYAYLVFSPQKDSVENELLYCRDIYNLTLNADLVVLSACETGIGKLSRGEGIISLARAFAFAGAKSIVNSLWSVNDISTQDLMIRFYENLQAGKNKSEALALAKRKFLDAPTDKEQKRYDNLKLQWEQFCHPYFWGGFILIGDDAAVKK